MATWEYVLVYVFNARSAVRFEAETILGPFLLALSTAALPVCSGPSLGLSYVIRQSWRRLQRWKAWRRPPEVGHLYHTPLRCMLNTRRLGQYHWVSEFAPPEYQKFLSYSAGAWASAAKGTPH